MLAQEYHTLAALEETHWWYGALRRRLLAHLGREALRQGRPLRVFDAGCGTGGLLRRLRGRADVARAEGCDIHPLALDYARSRGLTVWGRSVNALEGLPSDWDLVCSVDVLYHRQVVPGRALAGMAALLAPGGALLLNVAAMPCLARGHDLRVMGARRFLPAELRQLVATSGLEVEEVTYWNSLLTPLLWLRIRLDALVQDRASAAAQPAGRQDQAAASELRLPPPWLNRALGSVLELERRLPAWLPLPWGSSLMLLARKPLAPAPPA
jgi:SAM-dependent methyltransferase